jgi:hypothetical protein
LCEFYEKFGLPSELHAARMHTGRCMQAQHGKAMAVEGEEKKRGRKGINKRQNGYYQLQEFFINLYNQTSL